MPLLKPKHGLLPPPQPSARPSTQHLSPSLSSRRIWPPSPPPPKTPILFSPFPPEGKTPTALHLLLELVLPRRISSTPQAARSTLPTMAVVSNDFANQLARWIATEYEPSIVSIEFRPNPQVVFARWNKVSKLPLGHTEEDVQRRKLDSAKTVYATGFVIGVGEDDNGIYFVTCAHSLGPAFSPKHPITVQQMNMLYEPHVSCDHREQRFKMGVDPERMLPRRGELKAISPEHDLLLVRVDKFYFHHYCEHDHPPVIIGRHFPASLRSVLLLSWPMLCNRTEAIGQISNPSRQYDEISSTNPFGFRMSLSEVNIPSDAGSSGAPLFSSRGRVIGILHGGFGGRFTYFVGLAEIRETLTKWRWIQGTGDDSTDDDTKGSKKRKRT